MAEGILGIQHVLPVPDHASSLLECFFPNMAPNPKGLSRGLMRMKKRPPPVPARLGFPASVFTETEGCSPAPSAR